MASASVIPRDQPKKGIQSSKHNPLKQDSTATTDASTGKPISPTALRPTHFLVRPSASVGEPARMVPLIPVDLLPEYIDVDGVPRHLTAHEASGMKSIGKIDKPQGATNYNLRFLPVVSTQGRDVPVSVATANGIKMDMSSCTSGSTADDEGMTAASLSLHSSDTDLDIHPLKGPNTKKSTSSTLKNHSNKSAAASSSSSSPTPSSVDHILASASAAAAHHLTSPLGKKNKKEKHHSNKTVPDSAVSPLEKEDDGNTLLLPAQQQSASTSNHCRHFCHHGTCRFGLQCRYQHTVPTTPEGLREVGLREWPAWLLRSIRVAENMTAAGGGMAAFPPAPFHHAGMMPMGGMMAAMAAPYAGMAPQRHHHHHSQGQGQGQGQKTGKVQHQHHQQQQSSMSTAERKKREEWQVKKAEERMRALEVERAEAERLERVRAAKALKMSAAHADAAAAALREGELLGLGEMNLINV